MSYDHKHEKYIILQQILQICHITKKYQMCYMVINITNMIYQVKYKKYVILP